MNLLKIFTLIGTLLFASCGRILQDAENGLVEPAAEDEALIDSFAALNYDETYSVYWDFLVFAGNNARNNETPESSAAARAVFSRFNVQLDAVLVSEKIPAELYGSINDGAAESLRKAKEREDYNFPLVQYLDPSKRFPDIFSTEAKDCEGLIDAGAVRSIPTELLEKYSPGLALTRKMFAGHPEADYLLISCVWPEPTLADLSAYRLDWLEEIGVEPLGHVQKINEYVYFTDEAFALDEFVAIIKEFSRAHGDPGETAANLQGKFFGTSNPIEYVPQLMGAFGVTGKFMAENGRTVHFAESGGFRQFLEFIESIAAYARVSDPVAGENNRVEASDIRVPGWQPFDLNELTGEVKLERLLPKFYISGIKYLLTPPEIGRNGWQGTARTPELEPRISRLYMVGSNVSDAKLGRILEIFEALSFDPKWYLLANYGILGEEYEWTGAPMDSAIRIKLARKTFTGAFATGMEDGIAGKRVYDFVDEALYRYATGGAALAMLPGPTAPAPDGTLGSGPDAEAVDKIIKKYYADVLSGAKSVEFSWDDFLAFLYAASLENY